MSYTVQFTVHSADPSLDTAFVANPFLSQTITINDTSYEYLVNALGSTAPEDADARRIGQCIISGVAAYSNPIVPGSALFVDLDKLWTQSQFISPQVKWRFTHNS